MNDATSLFRPFGHSVFRMLVGVASVFILVWIALSGLVATARNPYLLAVYWLLGLVGLLACAGACTNVFPTREEERAVPHPMRALVCLASAVAIGAILWGQGRPVGEGPGADLAMIGVVLAMATVIGIGIVLALTAVLLWQSGSGDEEGESKPDPGLELNPQTGMDLAAEATAA